jgi:pSer/pThr/pTyr-binding forkhead associated (FHA) protein
MDEIRQQVAIAGLPWQRAEPGAREQAPGDFTPLRLLLQPGSLVIELTATDMVLGRHSEADIRLPLPDVSRRHCRFVYSNGNWQVIDLKSLNGVLVNDVLVERSSLYHGDRLRIGGLVFAVDLPHQQSEGEVVKPRPERSLHELFRVSNDRSRRRAG